MPLMRYLQLDEKTIVPPIVKGFLTQKLVLLFLCLVIAGEVITLLGYAQVGYVRLLLLLSGLSLVVWSADRYGWRSAVLMVALANGYLAYHLSPPGELWHLSMGSLRTLILFLLIGLLLAILVGRLSDKLRMAIYNEALARNDAEDRQRQLESILRQLPIGVLIIDMADTRISYSNPQVEELLGIKLGEVDAKAGDLSWLVKNSPELSKSDWPLYRALHGIESMIDQEVHYTKPNGQEAHLKIDAAPIQNSAGTTIAAVATVMDISLAKELERRKDEFISIASHELKTPVTSLKIYLQLLQKQNNVLNQQEQQELLQKANNQVTKLSSLMAELLDLSRLQSNKATYSFSDDCQVETLLHEVVDDARTSVPQTIRLEGQAARPIRADFSKLQRVVSNLINNASKYSTQDSTITVAYQQDAEQTAIEVRDEGDGISEAELRRIFDIFYQTKNAHQKSNSGLGIGLYVSDQIIRSHGGSIEVESQEGKGSTFRILLPR